MTRLAMLVNVCGAIAVTTAVLMARGLPDAHASSAAAIARTVLRVGDAANGYRLIHRPDAIHAFDNGDGTFTLLARAVGGLSRWVISADVFTLLDAASEANWQIARFATDVDAS